MLAAVEISTERPTPRNLSSRNFPMQMLCEMAGSVMDLNGDLLECIHLIRREEYIEMWCRLYGNELGRLAQGIYDIVKKNRHNIFHNKMKHTS